MEGYYSTKCYAFSIDSNDLLYNQEDTRKFWGSTDETITYRREWGGPVEKLAPTGTSWKKGETVTFYYTRTVDRAQDYDWNTDLLGDWEEWANNSMRAITLVHMGDFMLEVDSMSSKNSAY